MKNIYRLTLSFAFGFAGLTAAHSGETPTPFDNGVAVRSILNSLRQIPPVEDPQPVATEVISDKGTPANAGVKITLEVIDDYVYSPWQSQPVDIMPNDSVTLHFESTHGYNTVMSAVTVFLAPAAEASAACGRDQQMLMLENEIAGTVSRPPYACRGDSCTRKSSWQ